VTTNYDRHLATAAKEALGAEPKVYTAPALPHGREFNGIVYLHGSVDQEPGELIVTDADFGRAYLTDAWAARFLQELFRHYTVFFIGYRHNDVVMNYLARGLAPPLPATVRVHLRQPSPWWRGVRIEPVCYPGDNDHAALGEAVGEWADLSQMGLLEHEQRIIALTSQPPPDDLPNRAYLERMVTNADTTPLFTRHARGDDWLEWAGSLPLFRRLFQQAGELGPEVVGQMEELALRLWDAGADAEPPGTRATDGSQEQAAGWAWQLAGFWAQDTAARWRASEGSWDGLPGTAKTALAAMLAASGASVSAVGSHFALFVAADEAWAKENILPAFNWETDPARAASAWSGHLRGHWNNRAAALLRAYYEQSFANLGPEFQQQPPCPAPDQQPRGTSDGVPAACPFRRRTGVIHGHSWTSRQAA